MFCRNILSIAACISVQSCITYSFFFVRLLPASSCSSGWALALLGVSQYFKPNTVRLCSFH